MPQKLKSSFRLETAAEKIEPSPIVSAPGKKAPEQPATGTGPKKLAEISVKLPDLSRPYRWGWEREGTSNVL
ncbi:MAG: hypothetical protein JSS81_03275 [Acidobacteria bacterium]|nr:hypothetical protein [Acidobacteriota bacterium]